METLPGSVIALLLKGPLDGMRLTPEQYKDERGRALDVIKLPLLSKTYICPVPYDLTKPTPSGTEYHLCPLSVAINRDVSREFCVYVHSSVLASWTILDTIYFLFHSYPKQESR